MINKYTIDSKAHDVTGPSYRYQNDIGEISLVYPSRITFNSYEIYCIEGNLFEDIERFDSLEEAEKRINNLLLN